MSTGADCPLKTPPRPSSNNALQTHDTPTQVPLLAAPRLMGIYTGSTVHELAGVVAAGSNARPAVTVVTVVAVTQLQESWPRPAVRSTGVITTRATESK